MRGLVEELLDEAREATARLHGDQKLAIEKLIDAVAELASEVSR